MRRAALIASLALTGCFYVDPINQRPSLDINQEVVGAIYRDTDVAFTAIVVDPDDHGVDLTWRAYFCTDATTSASCDPEAGTSEVGDRFEFRVPRVRADGITAVQGMRIVLDGVDSHGANAKPADQLELPVLGRDPTVDPLQARSVYSEDGPVFPVGMPIDIFATYTDGDDALDRLTVDWKVFAPMQVPIDLTDRVIASPAGKKQEHKVLRPQVTGPWTVELNVTDPVGNRAKQMITVTVADDRAPCLVQSALSPTVPPANAELPVYDPTLFQAPSVDDDLDSYPREAGGAEFGETRYQWSILSPGNPRTVIGTGPSVLFDPAVYAPGTDVELRVEIFDRKNTPISCADGAQTCGPPACLQRQTWRVEAR